MNRCDFIVRLTADPVLTFSQGGMAICKFNGAVDKKLSKDKKSELQQKGEPVADFPRFLAFGKVAEVIGNNLSKGMQVGLETRFQSGSFTAQDGTKVYTNEFVVEQITFVGNKQENAHREPMAGGGSDEFDFGNYDPSDFQAVEDDEENSEKVPF